MKRILVDIQACIGSPAPVQARLLLNDLSPQGMGVFAAASIPAGEDVTITLTQPSALTLRGRVVYCQEHDPGSHVISQTPFAYRMGVHFLFESPAQEAEVQKILEALAAQILPAPAAA